MQERKNDWFDRLTNAQQKAVIYAFIVQTIKRMNK